MQHIFEILLGTEIIIPEISLDFPSYSDYLGDTR
jgi:hypothetical protein